SSQKNSKIPIEPLTRESSQKESSQQKLSQNESLQKKSKIPLNSIEEGIKKMIDSKNINVEILKKNSQEKTPTLNTPFEYDTFQHDEEIKNNVYVEEEMDYDVFEIFKSGVQ